MKEDASSLRSLEDCRKVVLAVDPTDTDNIELIVGTMSVVGPENVAVILTGRCALPVSVIKARVAESEANGIPPVRALPIGEWDPEFSTSLLEASALRFRKILGMFGGAGVPIFFGGLARAPKVPHALHFDDLRGFGDLSEEEIGGIERGENHVTQPISELPAFLADQDFVVLLGGPATGIDKAFTECPELMKQCLGLFAQYGSLGQVQGMRWEARSEKAQFNVMLDSTAGKSLLTKFQVENIPAWFLTTDVTRRGEIGFGSPAMIESIVRMDSLGALELARMRRLWYDAALRSRGEQILTHDMATLFAFMQMQGKADVVYSFRRARITDFCTEGPDDGAIAFELDVADSHLQVAVALVNREAYLNLLGQTLRASSMLKPQQVVLCTSLSPAQMEDSVLMERYNERIIAHVMLALRQGSHVHWGSHPAVAPVFKILAGMREYQGQLHQYLLRKYRSSQIPGIPAGNVHYYDDLDALRRDMLAGRDVGIFIGGRGDVENGETGYSGVLIEWLGFRIASPYGTPVIDVAVGGVVSLIAMLQTVDVFSKAFGAPQQMRALGSFLAGF